MIDFDERKARVIELKKGVIEHKTKIGGPELGKPRMEITYFSPHFGVPILEEGNPRDIICLMEDTLKISSYVDNY